MLAWIIESIWCTKKPLRDCFVLDEDMAGINILIRLCGFSVRRVYYYLCSRQVTNASRKASEWFISIGIMILMSVGKLYHSLNSTWTRCIGRLLYTVTWWLITCKQITCIGRTPHLVLETVYLVSENLELYSVCSIQSILLDVLLSNRILQFIGLYTSMTVLEMARRNSETSSRYIANYLLIYFLELCSFYDLRSFIVLITINYV